MDDNGATTDFARAGATSRSCAAGPDSPIPYWVSPAAQSCGAENPPIKPERQELSFAFHRWTAGKNAIQASDFRVS